MQEAWCREFCKQEIGTYDFPEVDTIIRELTNISTDKADFLDKIKFKNHGSALRFLAIDNEDAQVDVMCVIDEYCSNLGFPKSKTVGCKRDLVSSFHERDRSFDDFRVLCWGSLQGLGGSLSFCG